jgi:hypothetical protein
MIMNMQRYHAIVAELAAYAGVSTERIGRMTFLAASALYWAMRNDARAPFNVCDVVNKRG